MTPGMPIRAASRTYCRMASLRCLLNKMPTAIAARTALQILLRCQSVTRSWNASLSGTNDKLSKITSLFGNNSSTRCPALKLHALFGDALLKRLLDAQVIPVDLTDNVGGFLCWCLMATPEPVSLGELSPSVWARPPVWLSLLKRSRFCMGVWICGDVIERMQGNARKRSMIAKGTTTGFLCAFTRLA